MLRIVSILAIGVLVVGSGDCLLAQDVPASAPARADAAKIQDLVNGLGSDDYTVREQSQKDLAAMGLAAKDEIQKATQSDDLEVKQRAEQLMIGIRKAEQAVKNDSMKKNYLWGFAMDDGMTERPVVAGKIVLAAGLDGKVHALDIKTGKEVWVTVDAPPASVVAPASGPTSSPASSKPATVSASSPATTSASSPATASAPATAPAGVAVMQLQENVQVMVGNGPLMPIPVAPGAGPAAGASKTPVQAGEPIVCDDMVLYCDGKQINAASLNGGKLAWSFPGNNMPAAADGRVFVGSVEGGLTALDVKTGRQVWKNDNTIAALGRPAVGEGLVCIVGIDKKAGGSNAGGVVMGPGGMVQMNLGTHIQAFDVKTGKQLWTAQMQGCRGVHVKGGMVIVRFANGVAALDMKDGKTVWTQNIPPVARAANIRMIRGNAVQLGGPTVAGPAGDDLLITDDIICGIRDDEIVALNIKTGKESWKTKLDLRDADADSEADDNSQPRAMRPRRVMLQGGMQIQAQMVVGPNGQMVFNPTFVGECTPAVDEGTVYVAAMNGIHAIDIKTGQRLWHFRTAYVPNGKLALVDGVLYFGTAGQVQQSSGTVDVQGLNALKVK